MSPDDGNELDKHLTDLPHGHEEPAVFFKAESVVPPRAPEQAKAETYVPSTYEEKKEQKYWPVALVATLFVLGSGGFYAMTGMKDTAKKLGGGGMESSIQSERGASAGSSVFSRAWDIFADDEEEPSSAAAKLTNSLNPKLIKAAALANGKGSSATMPLENFEPGVDPDEARSVAPTPARRTSVPSGRMVQKLQAAVTTPGGAGGASSNTQGTGVGSGFGGGGNAVGVVSGQRDSAASGTPKGTNKQGVMDSLKAVFRTSLQGARIASQDSAKDWVAKTFHATSGDGTSLNYGEEFRNKLDKVNPNSIPNFLREQDLDGNNARRLANSKVGKPRLDSEGTKDALEEDEEYKRKKEFGEAAAGALGGGAKGGSGGGGGGGEGGGGDQKGGPTSASEGGKDAGEVFDSMSAKGDSNGNSDAGANTAGEAGANTAGNAGAVEQFSNPGVAPEDAKEYTNTVENPELKDWSDKYGYGASCGGTADSPVCCLDAFPGGKYKLDYPDTKENLVLNNLGKDPTLSTP